MGWYHWVVIGAFVVGFIWEFCMVCPDKIPFRRRKK